MNRYSMFALYALVLSACEAGDNTVGDVRIDPKPPTPPPQATGRCLVTPGAWTAPDFAANAKEALSLRTSLDQLVEHMRLSERQEVFATFTSMRDLLNAGEPALGTIIDGHWKPMLDQLFNEFEALSAAGVVDLVDDNNKWAPGNVGGLFGKDFRGINKGGLELRQFIDKGLYAGGGLYRYAVKLTEGDITPATIDALAAAWGSNATLDPATKTDSANYSFAMGYHKQIADQLTAARSYAASADCSAERDAAVVSFFRLWEEAMVSRTLFYATFAQKILAEAKDDNDRARALHEYSEGVALTLGYMHGPTVAKGPLSGRAQLLNDSDLAKALTPLGLNPHSFGASTVGLFIDDPASLKPALESAEKVLAPVFRWTADDLARFRAPTAG